MSSHRPFENNEISEQAGCSPSCPILMVVLPPSWHQAAIYENINVYGISSTADDKYPAYTRSPESRLCLQGPPLGGEVGVWEGEVMLGASRHLPWTPYLFYNKIFVLDTYATL
jgi:hypothetical protein